MESHGGLVFINKWQLNSISSATGYQWTDFRRKKSNFANEKCGWWNVTFENLDFSENCNFLKKKKFFENFEFLERYWDLEKFRFICSILIF